MNEQANVEKTEDCGPGPLFGKCAERLSILLYSCSQSVRILIFLPSTFHFIAPTHSSGVSAQSHLMQEVTLVPQIGRAFFLGFLHLS